MGFFGEIRRHAAVASANFDSIFKDTDEIPPFPAAAARLISELNRPNAQISEFSTMIASVPEVSAKVLRFVNSSFVASRSSITDIRQAISLLGIDHVKQIATAHVVRNSLPVPKEGLFNHEAFWGDCLLKALLAREFAKHTHPVDAEAVFTAALLSDIAIPVLLLSWSEYYEPIIELWEHSDHSLTEIERKSFQWDHAQAGAWMARSWGLPDELVCLIAGHNISSEEELGSGLKGTIIEPIRIASSVSSILKPEEKRSRMILNEVTQTLGLTLDQYSELVVNTADSYDGVRKLFDIANVSGDEVFDVLLGAVEEEREKKGS